MYLCINRCIHVSLCAYVSIPSIRSGKILNENKIYAGGTCTRILLLGSYVLFVKDTMT